MAKDLKYLDVVKHPDLGEGVVLGVIGGSDSNCFMIQVEWDDDPSESYNMGENPCMVYSSKVTLVSTTKSPT